MHVKYTHKHIAFYYTRSYYINARVNGKSLLKRFYARLIDRDEEILEIMAAVRLKHNIGYSPNIPNDVPVQAGKHDQ